MTDTELDALEVARATVRNLLQIEEGYKDDEGWLRAYCALREIENILQAHGRHVRRRTERYAIAS
jgi:hypothetical protein